MKNLDALNPLVSVVVTTRNEKRNIANCLQSIQLQTYAPIEIIVVDNNSTDETKTIAKEYTDTVVDKGPERSAQRNYGICDLATGNYAMFIDADMLLTPSLIEECVKVIAINGSVGIHIEEKVLGRSLLAKVRRYERSFYSGTVIDGIRFFDRLKFCSIGGFDIELPPGPEDWDIDKRMSNFGEFTLLEKTGASVEWKLSGYIASKGIKHKNSFVGIYHNEDDLNLRKYIRKKLYYGSSMARYIEKWTMNDADVKRQLGIKYRYFVVFFENKKWKKVLKNPILFGCVFLLKILVGGSYVYSKKKPVCNKIL